MGVEDLRCLDIIGSMIRGNIQLSDTEFRYYCCCYCPLLQLQDLELSLRVNVHKRATTGFCDVELMLVAEPGKRDMRIVKEFSKIKSVRSNCFFEIYISENWPYNRRTFTLYENEDLVFCPVFQFLSRLNLPTKLFPPLVLLSISLMTCGWTIPSNVKFSLEGWNSGYSYASLTRSSWQGDANFAGSCSEIRTFTARFEGPAVVVVAEKQELLTFLIFLCPI